MLPIVSGLLAQLAFDRHDVNGPGTPYVQQHISRI
jgi:hypothetical protein